MNVISYLNGESQITDNSPCVCVTIRPIAIFLNDFANDEQRKRLLPFILRAMGSATDDFEIMKYRIAAIVKYAELNARLAAEYANAAATAAEYAKAAIAAATAAKAAEYAAEYAKASEYVTRREAIFQAGLDYLNEVCPPAQEVNQEIIDRANCLVELQD